MFLYLAWWSNVSWKVLLLDYPTGISPLIHWKEGWRLDELKEEESGDGMLDGKGAEMFIVCEGMFKCHILALIFFSFTQVKVSSRGVAQTSETFKLMLMLLSLEFELYCIHLGCMACACCITACRRSFGPQFTPGYRRPEAPVADWSCLIQVIIR